jgi:hypothetical protein
VTSAEKATRVGAEQLVALLQDDPLPFHDPLSVHVADSTYSAIEYLGQVGPLPNLVSIVRVAENRVFYRQPLAAEGSLSQGHPTWYGAAFRLKDPDTWGTPAMIRVQLLSFTMFICEYAEFIRQAHKSVAVLALCISGRDFCARAGPALWFYHERTR